METGAPRSADEDTPETMIRRLSDCLTEREVPHRRDGKEPRLTFADGAVVVQCAPRAFMGGRLWFFFDNPGGDGRGIAPADDNHLPIAVDAVMAQLRLAAAGRS